MRRRVLAAAFLLLIAACGGGDDAAQDDVAAGADAATTTTAAPVQSGGDSSSGGSQTDGGASEDDASGGDSGGAAVSGLGVGSVTINGETYQFGDSGFPALQCNPDLFGVFFAVLAMVDDQGNEVADGGGLELVLLHPGSDPEELGQTNEARVRIGSLEEEWIADEEDIAERELDPGTSQVDSYTIDGDRASGTATFYEEETYWASVGDSSKTVSVTEGTFEVTCAG